MNDYNENDDIEGGLMDYRGGDIQVKHLEGKIGITLSFYVNITNDDIHERGLSIFPGEWCAKFDAEHIVQSYWTYNYDIVKGSSKWIGPTTLYFEIVADDTTDKNDIKYDLEYDSLEDGPYEGCSGDFWVIPVSAFS
jgi:hypothetical protein